MNPVRLSTLGSKESARAIFDKMAAGSPAYRRLVDGRSPDDWTALPVLTKKGFYEAHPWRELIPRESYRYIYSILRSSGTTAADGSSRGFFWPQLKSQDVKMGPRTQALLVETFRLEKRKTLIIVGLSLGSWAGGEQVSVMFKMLALRSLLPLVVFSPGNQHAEIIEIIEKVHEEFDQVLIALCPSAIFYLERLADQKGVKLPIEKIQYFVTGEPFPEEMRLNQRNMVSVYGAADTGSLGFESLPLIRIRQHLCQSPATAERLGFSSRSIPNLYHAQLEDTYLEEVNEELLVTKWQGLPLVRYNLQDKVRFFSWKGLCDALAQDNDDASNAALWKGIGKLELPDVLSVSGRSQGCVFLCGSNIFESMLQEVFLRSSLRESSTGTFVSWTGVQDGQQILSWQIELKPGAVPPAGPALEKIHSEFVELLSTQQPEFADDYEKFYRPFEGQGLRIFRFHFSESPRLSQHPRFSSGIKRKVIIDEGPL